MLTPTRSGLKVLIDICEKYAHEYCVNFNGTKSRYLIFRGRNCKPDNRTVFFNDTELYSTQDAVHLGHHISVVNKDSLVADATAKFWRGYNMFMADFGHIKTNVKCNLFKQYCCSYYGAPLWDLQSKSVGTICTAWRKALRKLWGLAPLTHGDVIALLSDSLPLLVILKQRFSKFIHKAMNHNSPIINSVAKLSIANPWSNCSANYRHILNECDTMYDVSVHDIGRVWQAGLSNVTISNVNVLSEMLDIRNGFKTCNILDDDDVNCIITDITVF